MAYEASEGLYAGLVLIDKGELMTAQRDGVAFKKLYDKAFNNLKDSNKIKDGAGNQTRNGLVNQIDLTNATAKKRKDIYDDMAGALSAVLATRSNKIKDAIPDFVYLTGNKWNSKVEKFKVDAFGMADYNSSDLILEYDGNQFAGVSLKKKRKANAPSPTMINNAFSKFIQGSEFLELRKKLDKERKKFFAKVIREASIDNGPLANLASSDESKAIAQLNPDNNANDVKALWDMKVKTSQVDSKGSNKYVALINLKDEDQLYTEGIAALPSKDSESKFRKFVNERLQSKGSQLNPLYQYFLNAMNNPDVKDTLADALLTRVLKTKLLDELDTWKENDFGFYVVEGVGSFNENTNMVQVSNASVYDIHTIMCAIASLAKEDTKIELDTKLTFAKSAAKVFFTLQKGDTPILDIELRYKGSFTAFPQFFATMTTDFQKLLKVGGCSEIS